MKKIIEYIKQLFSKKQNVVINKPAADIVTAIDSGKKDFTIEKPKTCPDNDIDYQYKFKMAVINKDAKYYLNKKADTILKDFIEYKKVSEHFKLPYINIEGYLLDPCFFIAAIHNQESSRDVGEFKACLHNGERIIGTGLKTTLVPKNRGPFNTWNEAAIDALKDESKIATGKLTTLGAWLYMLENYNGMGYRKNGVSSPYLWAMTDQYTKGYYVGDHNFQSEVVTDHFGAVALIKTIIEKQKTKLDA